MLKNMWNFEFFALSIGSGAALAMDAFSVSLANGLSEPKMKKRKMSLVAGIFALFQFAMPLIGWVLVHTLLETFAFMEYAIPWIALALLSFIGGKMLYESIKNDGEEQVASVGIAALFVQGIATSIDALSVGLTIADYDPVSALVSCLIIGVVTFAICMAGLAIGKKFGTKLAGRANILGGAILIVIGIEIFVTGLIDVFTA